LPGGHCTIRPRCGWPGGERPLGLVNVSPLRGGGAPHDPDATRSVQGCAALAAPLFSHVAPDREKNGPRDRRCPKRSRLGRSLQREQSQWGAPRYGVPRPLTLSSFGGCPIERQLSTMGSRPNDGFRSFGMFRVVRGRARGSIVCRSRESARGLEGAREERTNKGLVAVNRPR